MDMDTRTTLRPDSPCPASLNSSASASQAAQNQYLVQAIRPCPNPAYIVANPYCCGQQVYNG